MPVTDESSSNFGPARWNRLGVDIDGEASGDQSGFSLSLNGDGTKVGIGSYINSGNTGHVRVHNINKNISDIGSKEIVLKFFGNTV